MAVTHQSQSKAGAKGHPAGDDGDLPDSRRKGQLALNLGHLPSLSEMDFLVNPGNALAYEHLMAFPNWSGPLTLIVGPAKSGKSHLAHIWAVHADAAFLSQGQLEACAERGGASPVIVEDVDRAGYDEAALFHLLNQSMRDERPLLMTARDAVASWPFSTADVLSRARLAAHFALEMPDDIQLSQMFVKLFGDRQIAVDPKIIAYLVTRMERSSEAVFRLVEVMDRLALSKNAPVTRAIAAEALEILAMSAKKDSVENE